MINSARPLVTGFLDSVKIFPNRPAIQIRDASLSYAELGSKACTIAATLQSSNNHDKCTLTGIYAHRSFAAFAGIIAALKVGDGYVPLNPSFPIERTLKMIRRAGLSRIVVDQDSFESFVPILQKLQGDILVVLADGSSEPSGCENHTIICESELCAATDFTPATIDPEGLAYLLFTSGSTGDPKGVLVKQSNVTSFVDYMVDRYKIDENDRFSQTFDLTFDLSAFDMFVAWEKGACVCCPTQGEKLLPAKYILTQNISIWFSVPSTAIMMKKLRMLKPDSYPSLRYSLFCGEALPLEIAETFQQAAPNSKLENLYGPTELTIACTYYRYVSSLSKDESEQGVVPIGHPYPNMKILIADDRFEPVEEGTAGELLMTGPQLTDGYLDDEAKTNLAFVQPPGQSETYYRTGDLVRQRTASAPLVYLGRIDNQIKVQGYRVELGEIEAHIRTAAECDIAVAVGYPLGLNGADNIIAFVSESTVPDNIVLLALKEALPAYMLPRKIIQVSDFPLNSNGKIDRKQLLKNHENFI